FPPSVIAGVSIGAINAALMAGGRCGPVKTLEQAWQRFAMDLPPALPKSLQEAAANYGNPHFYLPRLDIADIFFWTYLYNVAPLRRTLEELVDFRKLNSPAAPKLVMTAVNVATGEIKAFSNRDQNQPITVEHILASGALPPSFPMADLGGKKYWDGGVFSNTPLKEAIEGYCTDGQKLLIVVDLFRNAGRIPANLQEVGSRFMEIIFSNKLSADVKAARTYNQFVATMRKIEELCPDINEKLRDDPGWQQLRQYDDIHPIVIGPTDDAGHVMQGGNNFSRDVLEKRIELGFKDTTRHLAKDERYHEML
ncbi:MAG: patatin-like phospholipase family protein, partial [Thermoguttaceae bacterium]